METLLAATVGLLFAAGLYMVNRRSIVKLTIGLALIGHATNLLVFTAAGLTRGRAPVIGAWEFRPAAPSADPLPQALILTAIVIGFALLAFALVLVHRTIALTGTDDVDRMRSSDA